MSTILIGSSIIFALINAVLAIISYVKESVNKGLLLPAITLSFLSVIFLFGAIFISGGMHIIMLFMSSAMLLIAAILYTMIAADRRSALTISASAISIITALIAAIVYIQGLFHYRHPAPADSDIMTQYPDPSEASSQLIELMNY